MLPGGAFIGNEIRGRPKGAAIIGACHSAAAIIHAPGFVGRHHWTRRLSDAHVTTGQPFPE